MSVRIEASGRRSVQVEVEVKGTPEEVWQAIATGPGLSSWFVPAVFEVRDGKPVSVTLTFGPGMDSKSAVTEWHAPHRWVGESAGWTPGSPPIANEWSVEARAGGVCIVRVAQSLFASTHEWDSQIEGAKDGWPAFLRTLQLYLAHFRGQGSAVMKWMAPAQGTDAEAWDMLTAAFGLQGAIVGQQFAAPAGVPPFSGVVEYIARAPYDALLRIDTPAAGIAALGAFTFPGGPTMVALNFFLYGDGAAGTVERETPRWDAWFQERFPASTA